MLFAKQCRQAWDAANPDRFAASFVVSVAARQTARHAGPGKRRPRRQTAGGFRISPRVAASFKYPSTSFMPWPVWSERPGRFPLKELPPKTGSGHGHGAAH